MIKKVFNILFLFISVFSFNLFVVSGAAPDRAKCDITITKKESGNIRLDWNCSEGKVKEFRVYATSDNSKIKIGCSGYACQIDGKQEEKGAWELDKSYFMEDTSYYIQFKTNSKNDAFKYIVLENFKINNMTAGQKQDVETGEIKGTADNNDKKDTTSWRSDDEEALNKEQIKESCTDFKDLIDEYWAWVVLLTPVGLMVLITMDFLKATATGDSDAISKSSSNAIKRTIAALLLLLLPVMLSTIFSMFGLGVCF